MSGVGCLSVQLVVYEALNLNSIVPKISRVESVTEQEGAFWILFSPSNPPFPKGPILEGACQLHNALNWIGPCCEIPSQLSQIRPKHSSNNS